MLDLYHAGREELIDLVLAQQDRLTDLEREVAQLQEGLAAQRATIAHLTQRLGEVLAALDAAADPAPGETGGRPGRPPGVPGLKPQQAPAPAPRPRKRRPHG